VLVLALYLTLERGAASKGTTGIGTLLAYTSLVMAGIAVFWALRCLAFASDMPKIATALKLLTADVNTTIHFFLGAVGFYAKKVIWPLPLDFAIVSIDPLYSLLGVILVVLSIYLVVRPSMGSGLLLAALFLVMPALPLTMGRVAWTPYAERYVYLALPFVILAVGGACSTLIKGRVVVACGVSILLVFAVCTTQRNLVWQKNLTLFADMVEKSPNFKPARGLYMVALYNRSHFDRAAEQYYIAQSLPSVLYDEEFDLVMAGMLSEQKKYHEAEVIYLKAVKKTKERNPKVLWALTTFYLSEYSRLVDSGEKLRIKKQVLECLEKIQIADNAPMTLYRISQIHLQLGEKERARLMLRGASKSLNDSDQAKVTLTRLLNQLEK
jgi:protein O-mannosyl-transferase